MKKILITGMLLVIVQVTNAQHINNVFAFKTEKKHSIMLNLEFNPALFWGITYNRSFDIKIGKFERRLGSQIGWKTFKFNYNDLNLNFFTTVMNSHVKTNILVNLSAENKYLENSVHQANIYNWAASIMPGYYSDKWYVGTEIMYKWLFRARYQHTEFYKEIFPDVKDGWYNYKNAYLNLSVNIGVKMTHQMDVDFSVGYRLTNDFKNYQPYLIPYFSNLAINYRF